MGLTVNQHPNATAAGGSTGLGVLAVWLLGHFGVQIGAEEAAAIVGAAATIILFVGRNGLRGAWQRIWRGPK